MARRNFNDGQEVTYGDLNAISPAQERTLLDRILPELVKRQTTRVWGTSFKVSYISATSVSVAAGLGIYNDVAQVSPEPINRLLYGASAVTKTLEAAHPTNNRKDIISIKAILADELSDTRKYKAASDSAISNVTMVLQKEWDLEILVTKGVEDGSVAIPSTPTGYLKIAEVLVTASTGLGSQVGITDKRPKFAYDGFEAVVGTSAICSHETLALALADDNVPAGSRIKIESSAAITSGVEITKANIELFFSPGVTYTKGDAATEAIHVQAEGFRLNGGRFADFNGGSDCGIRIDAACDYAICIGQRFSDCTEDFTDDSGTATILANVQE